MGPTNYLPHHKQLTAGVCIDKTFVRTGWLCIHFAVKRVEGISLSNRINQRNWSESNQEPNESFMHSKMLQITAILPFLLPFLSLLPYFSLQPQSVSLSLPLQSISHPSPPCLNSLWTPNANSVRHLIRHINSISPLIALIPFCNEFLCSIPSEQQNFKPQCWPRSVKGFI